MEPQILTISPKGQITLPISERRTLKSRKLFFQITDEGYLLRPIKIQVIKNKKNNATKKDDLADFGKLSSKSFEFWNNEDDDIYQTFYYKNQKT